MVEESGGVDASAVGVAGGEVAEPAELPQDTAEWAGCWFELTADYGEGVGMVPAGTRVRVLGVYAPGTPGVGAADSDSPIAQWVQQAPSGRWVPRNVHFTAEQFRALFTPAAEPPQWQEWLDQQSGG
jgi:hypothetical protein